MSRTDPADDERRRMAARERLRELATSLGMLVVFMAMAISSRWLLADVTTLDPASAGVVKLMPYIFLVMAIVQVGLVLLRWSLYRSCRPPRTGGGR